MPADVILTGDIFTQGSSWTLASAPAPVHDGLHEPLLKLRLGLQQRGQETTRSRGAPRRRRRSGSSGVSSRDSTAADHGHHHADCAHQYVHEDTVGHPARSKRRRAGNNGPKSGRHTECRIFADADAYFYNQWKGECLSSWSEAECTARQLARVTVRMIDTLHKIDGLYRRDSSVSAKVTLAVAGTHIFTAAGGGTSSDSGGFPDMKGTSQASSHCPSYTHTEDKECLQLRFNFFFLTFFFHFGF